jgi:hypothetical protein
MSSDGQMNNKKEVYPHNGILFCLKNERNSDMDETLGNIQNEISQSQKTNRV